MLDLLTSHLARVALTARWALVASVLDLAASICRVAKRCVSTLLCLYHVVLRGYEYSALRSRGDLRMIMKGRVTKSRGRNFMVCLFGTSGRQATDKGQVKNPTLDAVASIKLGKDRKTRSSQS